MAIIYEKPPIVGAVLAGGKSSRLGQDKATITLPQDPPRDLLARSAELLLELVGDVLIVGRNHADYPSTVDYVPEKGPVGGISTALEKWQDKAILVLSCDLPFMKTEVLARLIHARNTAPQGTLMTAYRQINTKRIEALVAIYEPGSAPFFKQCVTDSLLKVSQVVPEPTQQYVSYTAEESLPFFNINYPADLEMVRQLLRLVNER